MVAVTRAIYFFILAHTFTLVVVFGVIRQDNKIGGVEEGLGGAPTPQTDPPNPLQRYSGCGGGDRGAAKPLSSPLPPQITTDSRPFFQ